MPPLAHPQWRWRSLQPSIGSDSFAIQDQDAYNGAKGVALCCGVKCPLPVHAWEIRFDGLNEARETDLPHGRRCKLRRDVSSRRRSA